MAKQYLMPYTNLHELNLDWLINAMKHLEASWDGLEMKATATVETSTGSPSVEVSGSLKDTIKFDFKLPSGSAYPSDTAPKVDSGEGAVGTETSFARGDHVHPSDTTKLDKVTYSDETALYAVISDTQVMLPYSGFATDTDVANLQSAINTKQDVLVSGTTLRTINDNSLLGSGNIETCQLWPLWTNASPTTEFAGQSITVSNSFDLYAVLFRIVNDTNEHTVLSFCNKSSLITVSSVWGTNFVSRPYIKQTNEILFYDAYVNSSTANNYLIPIKIYGIQ